MPDAPKCPYPGLRAYSPDESQWYFGREAHVDAMLSRLEDERFLAVVGASGSGKSSLVFAGLVPALHEGYLAGVAMREDGSPTPWQIVDLHPGTAPMQAMANAICRFAPRAGNPELPGLVRVAMHRGVNGITDALDVAGYFEAEGETLLYVDQFEELFRLRSRDAAAVDESLRFARLIVAAAESREKPLRVMLSMRSEFIGECELFPGLPALVSRGQFLAPRLTRMQLEQSLRCPAEEAGWSVEPTAISAILNDCDTTADQLPLAQHVLRRMWFRAAGAGRTVLTLKDYYDAGRIGGSLEQHGDSVLRQLDPTLEYPQKTWPEKESDIARAARVLFMCLCEQSEDGPVVRRFSSADEAGLLYGVDSRLAAEISVVKSGPTLATKMRDRFSVLRAVDQVRREAVETVAFAFMREEVREIPENAKAEIKRLIEKVIKAFSGEDPGFIREDAGILDIRHEAIFRQWPVIAVWRDREGRSRAQLRGLKNATESWRKGEGEKWRGKGLTHAVGWFLREKPSQSWARRYGVELKPCVEFLQASTRTAVIKKIALLIAFYGVFIGSVIVANHMRELAENAKDARGVADTQRAQAVKNEKKQREVAVATGTFVDIIADATNPFIDSALTEGLARASAAKDSLELVKSKKRTEDFELLDRTLNRAIEWENRMRSALEQDSGAKIPAELPQELAAKLPAFLKSAQAKADKPMQEIKAIRESSDLAAAVRGRLDEAADAFDKICANAELAISIANIPSAGAARFLAGEAETAYLAYERVPLQFIWAEWKKYADLKKTAFARLEAIRADIDDLEESAGGFAWTVDRARILHHEKPVLSIQFAPADSPAGAPDKGWLLTASGDKTVAIWNRQGEKLSEKLGSTDAVNEAEFSPKELVMAAASNGSTVRVYSLLEASKNVRIRAYEGHSDSVTSIHFAPSGSVLTSCGVDRTVRVFEVASLRTLYYSSPPLPKTLTFVRFNPSGKQIVSSCEDGIVRLHHPDLRKVRPLGDTLGVPVRRASFSADGKLIVASAGNAAFLWQAPGDDVWEPAEKPNVQQSQYEQKSAPVEVTSGTKFDIVPVRFDHPTTVNYSMFRPLKANAPAQIVTCCEDGDVRIISLGGPLPLPLEHGHHLSVRSADWSANGRWLATASEDSSALLWDCLGEKPKPVASFTGHNRKVKVTIVRLSPDATHLATAGEDNQALLWDISRLTKEQ